MLPFPLFRDPTQLPQHSHFVTDLISVFLCLKPPSGFPFPRNASQVCTMACHVCGSDPWVPLTSSPGLCPSLPLLRPHGLLLFRLGLAVSLCFHCACPTSARLPASGLPSPNSGLPSPSSGLPSHVTWPVRPPLAPYLGQHLLGLLSPLSLLYLSP